MKVFRTKIGSPNIARHNHKLCVLAVFPALACLVVSCANDPTQRRSAVDRAKLCQDDSQAVFEGQCLQRGANIEAAPPPGGKEPPAPDGKEPPLPDGKEPPKEEPAKNRLVVFKQDSFVAIASQSIVSNCFVPNGTKIEVSGDVSAVTQFKDLGVEQNIAFKVVAVTYAAAGAGACALNGKNFVYLSNHADLQEKP